LEGGGGAAGVVHGIDTICGKMGGGGEWFTSRGLLEKVSSFSCKNELPKINGKKESKD
jgi:hypothetical protein